MKSNLVILWALLGLCLVGATIYTIIENKPAEESFYTEPVVQYGPSRPQSVFLASQVPRAVARGRGLENKELRLVVEAREGGQAVMRAEPVMIAGGNYHAWQMPGLKPGAYVVALLVDGRRERELEIEVRK